MEQSSGSLASAPASVLYVVEGEPVEREIRECDTAEAFLDQVGDGKPFVLIAATHLPGLSGLELLRKLRERGIQAPVILISDDSDIPTAVDAIRSGAADFVERPYIDRILLRRIEAALECGDTAV
jgi:two-component system response regulator FixJ